jgi:hypothetical protein
VGRRPRRTRPTLTTPGGPPAAHRDHSGTTPTATNRLLGGPVGGARGTPASDRGRWHGDLAPVAGTGRPRYPLLGLPLPPPPRAILPDGYRPGGAGARERSARRCWRRRPSAGSRDGRPAQDLGLRAAPGRSPASGRRVCLRPSLADLDSAAGACRCLLRRGTPPGGARPPQRRDRAGQLRRSPGAAELSRVRRALWRSARPVPPSYARAHREGRAGRRARRAAELPGRPGAEAHHPGEWGRAALVSDHRGAAHPWDDERGAPAPLRGGRAGPTPALAHHAL